MKDSPNKPVLLCLAGFCLAFCLSPYWNYSLTFHILSILQTSGSHHEIHSFFLPSLPPFSSFLTSLPPSPSSLSFKSLNFGGGGHPSGVQWAQRPHLEVLKGFHCCMWRCSHSFPLFLFLSSCCSFFHLGLFITSFATDFFSGNFMEFQSLGCLSLHYIQILLSQTTHSFL